MTDTLYKEKTMAPADFNNTPVLRSPATMMSTERVAAATNNPLSFSRTAMRELVRGKWRIEKDRFDLDADGRGEILYRLTNGEWEFHFFLISNKLPEDQKLDRNFAGTWEAMGALCEGAWTPEREAHLRREIPKQVAGRADYDTLVYVRGNRSGRLFQHVIDSLAQGKQPDAQQIANVGYILRTTAFIGNGQLGTRPLAGYAHDHPMRRPYHAQIWSAFLLREYVFDLVDHMARAQNPNAVRLSTEIRRYLGLGNSAATGLVPFIATHPLLIHRWVKTQETAAAMARARRPNVSDSCFETFHSLLNRAIQYFREDNSPDDGIFVTANTIASELSSLIPLVEQLVKNGTIDGQRHDQPWSALHDWLEERTSADTVEIYNAILLDVYPDIVEQFIDGFMGNERITLDPAMSTGQLQLHINQEYDWVRKELTRPDDDFYFWYRAEAAPFDLRRGERGVAPELEFETPMDTTRLIHELQEELSRYSTDTPVAEVLLHRPDLRRIVRRVQSIAQSPYGELRTNLLSRSFSPFGPVRFILAFYGMEKFEGASPKVVRGAFLQGAPIAEDVENGRDGSWPFPLIPNSRSENVPALQDRAPGKNPTLHQKAQHSAAPATPADHATSDTLISAPVELQRLIQTSLHGAGLQMGTAEESAETALLHEAMTGDDLEQLLTILNLDLTGQDSPQCLSTDEIALRLDANHATALSVAPSALDASNSRALRNSQGLGLTFVRHANQADMLMHLAIRSAERNVLGLVIWKANKKFGFSLSGPSAPHPWLLHGELTGVPSLFARESGATHDAADDLNDKLFKTGGLDNTTTLLEWLTDTLTIVDTSIEDIPDGFLVLSLRLGAVDATSLFDAVIRWNTQNTAAVEQATLQSPDTMSELAVRWHREGLHIRQSSFYALSKAARKILVPNAEEHRLRPNEVIDPLKMF